MGGDGRPQGEGGDGHRDGVGRCEGLEALEWSHGHVGGDGRPQGEGGEGHGDGVGHGEDLEALEWSHGHVGGDGRPQGEGGTDFTKWFMSPNLSRKSVNEISHFA